MKNKLIKEKLNSMKSKDILDQIVMDALLEIKYRKKLSEDVIERIVLTHLSFFGDINFIEYEDLTTYEKNVICRIISKGLSSIYVDDEYLTKENIKEKTIIINELINFLCVLTKLNRSTVKRLVIRDIKIYIYKGWSWNFL